MKTKIVVIALLLGIVPASRADFTAIRDGDTVCVKPWNFVFNLKTLSDKIPQGTTDATILLAVAGIGRDLTTAELAVCESSQPTYDTTWFVAPNGSYATRPTKMMSLSGLVNNPDKSVVANVGEPCMPGSGILISGRNQQYHPVYRLSGVGFAVYAVCEQK